MSGSLDGVSARSFVAWQFRSCVCAFVRCRQHACQKGHNEKSRICLVTIRSWGVASYFCGRSGSRPDRDAVPYNIVVLTSWVSLFHFPGFMFSCFRTEGWVAMQNEELMRSVAYNERLLWRPSLAGDLNPPCPAKGPLCTQGESCNTGRVLLRTPSFPQQIPCKTMMTMALPEWSKRMLV